MTDTQLEGYMTTAEAAEYLGITAIGVRQHIRRKNIKALKVGSVWLIPVDEVEKIKDLKPGPKPQKGIDG